MAVKLQFLMIFPGSVAHLAEIFRIDPALVLTSSLCNLHTYFGNFFPHFFLGFSCALLTYFIFLPESPRWDLYGGNTEKARNTFLRIAKTNGIDISQTNFQRYFEILKDQTVKDKKQRDVIQEVKNIGKNGEFMKRLILLIPPWFCIGMG